MAVLTGDPDYIRRRKNVSSKRDQKLLQQKRKKPNRLTRLKNATLNWLNGLPPTDYDSALQEFNAENFRRDSLPGTPRHDSKGEADADSFEPSDEEILEGNENSSKKRRSFRKKLKKLRRIFLRKDKRKQAAIESTETDELLGFDEKEIGKFFYQYFYLIC